jgi:hypothetical protein
MALIVPRRKKSDYKSERRGRKVVDFRLPLCRHNSMPRRKSRRSAEPEMVQSFSSMTDESAGTV